MPDPNSVSNNLSFIEQLQAEAASESTPLNTFTAPTISTAVLPNADRYPTFYPGVDNENLYAINQSRAEKWGNAFVKMGATALSTAIQGTVGVINGLSEFGQTGKVSSIYNNDLSNKIDNWNNIYLENNFPNYVDTKEANAVWYSPDNWWTTNFWANKIMKNMGYTIGALTSGWAWGQAFKAIGLTGRLAATEGGLVRNGEISDQLVNTNPNLSTWNNYAGELGNLAKQYSTRYNILDKGQRLIQLGVSTTGEAYMEALQNLNQYRQKSIQDFYNKNGYLPEGEELDKINSSSEGVGNASFGMNMALLTATNYIQFPKIMGQGWNKNKPIINQTEDVALVNGIYQVEKSTSKFGRIMDAIKPYRSLFFSPSEGFEEGAQYAIQVGTQKFWDRKREQPDISTLDNLFQSTSEAINQTLSSNEGLESILLGALTGGLMEVRGIRENVRERAQIKNNTQNLVNNLNSTYNNSYLSKMVGSVIAQESLAKDQRQALLNNDELAYKDLETDGYMNYLLPRIQYNRFDILKQELGDLRNLASTDEGLQQIYGDGIFAPFVSKEEVLNQINNIEYLANTTKNTLDTLSLRYGGIQNKDGSLKYSQDVLAKMAYSSAKIDDYNKRIADLTGEFNKNGVVILPFVQSVFNDTFEPQDIDNLINRIDLLNVNPERKVDLKNYTADILELSARRRLYTQEYEQIKNNPELYEEQEKKLIEDEQEVNLQTPEDVEPEQNEGDYELVQMVADDISKGIDISQDAEALQLQQNYPKLLESYLNQLREQQTAPKQQFVLDNEGKTFKFQGEDGNLTYNPENNQILFNGREVTNQDFQEGLITSNDTITDTSNYLNSTDERTQTVGQTRTIEFFQNELDQTTNRLQEVNDRIQQRKDEIRQLEDDIKVEQWKSEEAVAKKKAWVPRFTQAINVFQSLRDEAQVDLDNLNVEQQNLQARQSELQTLLDNPPPSIRSSQDLLQRQIQQLENLTLINGQAINSLSDIIDQTQKLIKRLSNTIKSKLESITNRPPVVETAIRAIDQESPELASILQQVQQIEDFQITPARARENATIGQIQDLYKQIQDYENQIRAKQDILNQLTKTQGEINTRQQIELTVTPQEVLTESAVPQSQPTITEVEEVSYEGEQKPDDIVYKSTILLTTREERENTPWYKKFETFTYKYPSFSQELKGKLRMVLVTANNEESLGVSGLVNNLYKDRKGKNFFKTKEDATNPQTGAIAAVLVDNEGNFIDQNGNIIGKVGETIDIKSLVVNKMPSSSTSYATSNQQRAAQKSSILLEERAKAWEADRTAIINSETPRYSTFKLSKGSRERNIKREDIQIVGNYINEDQINEKGLLQVATSDNNFKVGNRTVKGGTMYLSLGDGTIEQVFPRKLNEDEVNKVYDLLKLLKEGNQEQNTQITNYLKGLFFFNTTDNLGVLTLGQETFTLLEGNYIEENEEQLKNALRNTNTSVNNDLVKENSNFQEIVSVQGNNLTFAHWETYQGFVLSPTYQTVDDIQGERQPLVHGTTNPSAFVDKYAILDNINAESDVRVGNQAIIDEADQIISPQKLNVFLQTPREENLPEPSEVTKTWLDTFAEGIGLNVQEVENISINGQTLGATGMALPLQQTVLFVSGNTNAKTEEMMHIAVEMVSQKNPELYKQMFDKASSLPIYKEVFDIYKNNPFYQKNGKIDIAKIKKEVIGKQLTRTIINEPKIKSWWQKVLDFLKGLFGNYADGLQVYRDTVDYILNEDLGTIRDTLLKSESYLREQGFNDNQVSRILELANSNITNDELKTAISDIIPTYGFLQINLSNQTSAYNRIIADNDRVEETNGEYFIDNKPIKNNLITKAEKFVKSKIGAITDKAKEILAEINNNPTSLVKAQTRDVLNRFIDEDGFLLPEQKRKERKSFQDDPNYDAVETEVRQYLESFPKGTRFINNNNIYSPKTDTVATPDIVAIDPEGKASIILFQETNFKEGEFMDNVEAQALKLQVDTTRDILRNQYGIINFGQLRIQPINKLENDGIIKIETNIDNESPYYLTPIPSDLEKTNSLKLNGILAEIRKLFNQRYKDLDEGDKIKTELLGLMKSARRVQVSKDIRALVSQSERLPDVIDDISNEYDESIKGKKPNKEKLNDFTKRIYILSSVTNSLKELQSALGEYIDNERDLSKVTNASAKVLTASAKLDKIQVEFTNDQIAIPNGINDLTSPQVQVGYFTKALRDISQANIAPAEVLGSLVGNTNSRIELIQRESIEKIKDIKKSFDPWRKEKNLTIENQLDLLTQKDKSGRYIHKLIDRIDTSFYETVKTARETGNLNLLDDIIDFPAYEKDFQKLKEQRTRGIINSVNTKENLTEEEKQTEINKRIAETIDIYDLSKGLSKDNNRIKNFPIEGNINYSESYKTLKQPENKPAFELYNYIQSLNRRAVDSGMMTEYEARTFLPIDRKSLADRMMSGKVKGVSKDFIAAITISEEDAEYLAKNDITGEEERRLPVRFMYDISKTMTDPETGEEFKDTSDISKNIFPLLARYENEITKYELFSNNVEYQMLNVSQVMHSIPGIQTTIFGQVSNTAGQVSNSSNVKYINDLIDLSVYGKRQQFDISLGDLNKGAETVNKTLGQDLIPKTDKESKISAAKLARHSKTWMILKTLGWKLPTAVAQAAGSSFQGHIEAGGFFPKNTYAKWWLSLFKDKVGEKFGGGKDNKILALLDAVMPLGRNERNQKSVRQLSQDKLNKFSFPKFMMTLTDISDKPQVYATTLSLLEYTMIEDGKLVNIQKYVRDKSNWATLPTKEERDAAKAQIEKDIETLKNERGLEQVAYWEDGHIKIPGVEFTSEEFAKYRKQAMNISSNSTGMSDNVAGGDGNFLFQMAKTFKSWIYPLYYRRVGNLRYTPGTDSYDWGRYRIFLNFMSESLKSRGQFALDLMQSNDRGINALLEMYQKQREDYFKRTGRELNKDFNESRFVELYQQGMKNALTELAYITALMTLVISVAALAPDDGDDSKEAKNFYNYVLKTTDKGLDELLFFINPKEMVKLSEGGIMPPIAAVKDIMKINQHLKNEVIGRITGDVDQTEKALPTKYIIKSLPLGSNVLMPIIGWADDDLAKELGYKETGLIEKLQ